MPNRLVGIVACLLLANVLNYALGEWVTDFTSPTPGTYGQAEAPPASNFALSLRPETPPEYQTSAADRILPDYFAYLGGGGGERLQQVLKDAEPYLAAAQPVSTYSREGTTTAPTAYYQRAVTQAATFNTERFLALLLLAASLICLYAGFLRETNKLTPLLYLLFTAATAALYGHLDSYLFISLVTGAWIIYYVGLRLCLPIYHAEWSRLIRPSLTPVIFLLAVMAFRGPDLPDVWFWTSPLFRLALTFTLLLAAYFHFTILFRVLRSAKLRSVARWFAVGIPLGLTLLTLGLFLGLYAPAAGPPLAVINYELVLLPPEWAAGWDPDAPLVVALGGFLVLIASGIGYFVQRIAH